MRWESDSMGRSKESVSISMIGVCSVHIGLNHMGYSGTDIVLNGAWIAGISSQTSHSLQWSLERATTVCLEQGGNPFSIHSRHCNLSFVSHTDILHMADKIAHLHQYIYIARIQTKTYTLYSSVHFKAQP